MSAQTEQYPERYPVSCLDALAGGLRSEPDPLVLAKFSQLKMMACGQPELSEKAQSPACERRAEAVLEPSRRLREHSPSTPTDPSGPLLRKALLVPLGVRWCHR